MKYEDFICYVKEKVQTQMGETVRVDLRSVTKNNGIEMDGLSIIKADQKVAPMIYLNDYYEAYSQGTTIPELVNAVLEVYEKAVVNMSFDTEFYMDFGKVKDKIACKLINYEKNKELLKKIPYFMCMDLAIVFYYLVENTEIGDGTILIHNSHLKMWKKTKEEIYECARENTSELLPYEFKSMGELLEDAFGDEYEPVNNPVPMYVLSNDKKYLGAATILYDKILSKIGTYLKGDFYVLPSSVHEVIIVPAAIEITKNELQDMVKEINGSQVLPEEILSDRVYYYECKRHRLSL